MDIVVCVKTNPDLQMVRVKDRVAVTEAVPFKIGDLVNVDLVKVDLARKFIDFQIAGQKDASKFMPGKKKAGPPRSKQKKQQVTLTGNRPHGPKQHKRRKRK